MDKIEKAEIRMPKMGYHIEKRILRQGSKDMLFISHLFVVDRFGNYLFIHLNIDEGFHYDPKVDKSFQNLSGQLIPSDLIIPKMECVRDICNIAFVCQGNYCFSKRLEEGIRFESVVIPPKDGSYVYVGEAAIAYPLFEISEVLTFPIETQEGTENSIQKLDHESFSTAVKEVDDYKHKIISEFSKCYSTMVSNIVKFNTKSLEEGKKYHEKITKILSSSKESEPTRETEEIFSFKKKHNEHRSELLKILYQTRREFEEFKHFITFFKSMNDHIEQMEG